MNRWLRDPRLQALHARWLRFSRPLLDHFFGPWLEAPELVGADWAADVEAARLAQEPIRARKLLRVTFLAVLLLIWWAAVARIDEVTRGEAKVVPSRQVQIIQSLDGGIVSKILVREGQAVEAGEILVRIDATRSQSSLSENRAQYLSLLAKTQRLSAIAEGKDFVVPPEVQAEAPQIGEAEGRLFEARRAELESQIGIAREQMTQREQELREANALYQQASRGLSLAQQELDATRPLVDSGAVSEVEVLRLEREVSRLRGDREQGSAQRTRAQAAIEEARKKIDTVELDFRNKVRSELADSMSTLNSLVEGAKGLQDRVTQAAVRSPVRGTIKRLMVNTEGGVILPGRDIVEIVPTDDTLLLEAKIAPRDIAFLSPGQRALVKFTAYDFVIYGGMEAEVEAIGADTITDDKGNAFYLVKVRTHSPTLGKKKLPIIPGMVAEVDILTGEKSVLSYLMKPVLRAKRNALSER